MRIKVGDAWYQPEPGQPIAVELSVSDKEMIAGMLPKNTRYAVFAVDERMDLAARKKWIRK